MKIYKKHDDSATLSESIIIIPNNIKVCNRNNYIKINKQTGSKTPEDAAEYAVTLWHHVKQTGTKTVPTYIVCSGNLWHHVKQTGSKTSYHLFNMIGVDQNRFLGVKQIKSAIAFLANVS